MELRCKQIEQPVMQCSNIRWIWLGDEIAFCQICRGFFLDMILICSFEIGFLLKRMNFVYTMKMFSVDRLTTLTNLAFSVKIIIIKQTVRTL